MAMFRNHSHFHWTGVATLVLAVLTVAGVAQVAHAEAAKTETVALTTTVRPGATDQEKKMAGNLLSLLELNVLRQGGIQVVERTEVDALTYELVLSRAQQTDEATKLQFGKLTAAKLILTAKLQRADAKRQLFVAVRVTESLSGAIRGATIAPITPTTIQEAAEQIAGYLSACVAAPKMPSVTIAVAPFESLGRFDRLRPLERGLRDMATSQLLRYRRFQVLQRTELAQLLKEIDLVRSGVADHSALPETLPSRRAAYFLRGTVDEHNTEAGLTVVVRAELIQAETKKTIDRIAFESTPSSLPRNFAIHIHRLAKSVLENAGDRHTDTVAPKFDEVDHLYEAAVEDLQNFWRRKPRDFSFRDFPLHASHSTEHNRSGRIAIDAPLGKALLRKSLDRLESVLYLQPERADAAYALAFCLSCQIDDLWDPKRAADLLRQVFYRDRSGPLAPEALNLLAELYYHHENGTVKQSDKAAARAEILFAFENMPKSHRDYEWARLVDLVMRLDSRGEEIAQRVSLMHRVAELAETHGAPQQRQLAQYAASLAASLFVAAKDHPELENEANDLLQRWKDGDQKWLKFEAIQTLARVAENRKKHRDAARLYLLAADLFKFSVNQADVHTREGTQLNGARCLREGGAANEALALVQSFKPSSRNPTSLLNGYYGLELGACQEAVGRVAEARETYTRYAEECCNLVDNTDVVSRIDKLGGVPLRADSDIEVQYIDRADGQTVYVRSLASDGQRLFIGGDYRAPGNRGVTAYDFATENWTSLAGPTVRASCLACESAALWVGTDTDGLWRCDLATGQWKNWTTADGLPDNRVVDIALHDGDAIVSIGGRNSGGVVRVDANRHIHIYDGPGAPRVALDDLAVAGNQVYGSNRGTYLLNLTTNKWQTDAIAKLDERQAPMSIFQAAGRLWGWKYGREIFQPLLSPEDNNRFKRAWFPRGLEKAGYEVRFVFEHDRQLWFGGSPWWRFKSAGFYRLDVDTGDFVIYGPRDGFRTSTTYECFDGLYAANNIWLATSAGLAKVTTRTRAGEVTPSSPER